jgi:hypothetical protein
MRSGDVVPFVIELAADCDDVMIVADCDALQGFSRRTRRPKLAWQEAVVPELHVAKTEVSVMRFCSVSRTRVTCALSRCRVLDRRVTLNNNGAHPLVVQAGLTQHYEQTFWTETKGQIHEDLHPGRCGCANGGPRCSQNLLS